MMRIRKPETMTTTTQMKHASNPTAMKKVDKTHRGNASSRRLATTWDRTTPNWTTMLWMTPATPQSRAAVPPPPYPNALVARNPAFGNEGKEAGGKKRVFCFL
jgi:hypothetical protein